MIKGKYKKHFSFVIFWGYCKHTQIVRFGYIPLYIITLPEKSPFFLEKIKFCKIGWLVQSRSPVSYFSHSLSCVSCSLTRGLDFWPGHFISSLSSSFLHPHFSTIDIFSITFFCPFFGPGSVQSVLYQNSECWGHLGHFDPQTMLAPSMLSKVSTHVPFHHQYWHPRIHH